MLYSKDSKKPVTLYLFSDIYEQYQAVAIKDGRKTAELIRDAMEEYAQNHFYKKHSISELNFDNGVLLKKGAKDFIEEDSWRSDIFDDGVRI